MNAGQRALQFGCLGSTLVGIIDVPERALPRGVLVVTGAPQYRIGRHRQFTLLSRLLATRGIPVLRFDHRGMGDSEGDAREIDALDDDIRCAVKEFFMQMPEMKEIVIWGLGDAATACALYAPGDRRISGVILLNPAWHDKAEGMRAAAGDRGLPLSQRTIAGLASFDGAALVVLSGGDPSAGEFAELLERHVARCKRVTLAGADQTFGSRASRDAVAELCANWIVSW